jgi:hypothetical protein
MIIIFLFCASTFALIGGRERKSHKFRKKKEQYSGGLEREYRPFYFFPESFWKIVT